METINVFQAPIGALSTPDPLALPGTAAGVVEQQQGWVQRVSTRAARAALRLGVGVPFAVVAGAAPVVAVIAEAPAAAAAGSQDLPLLIDLVPGTCPRVESGIDYSVGLINRSGKYVEVTARITAADGTPITPTKSPDQSVTTRDGNSPATNPAFANVFGFVWPNINPDIPNPNGATVQIISVIEVGTHEPVATALDSQKINCNNSPQPTTTTTSTTVAITAAPTTTASTAPHATPSSPNTSTAPRPRTTQPKAEVAVAPSTPSTLATTTSTESTTTTTVATTTTLAEATTVPVAQAVEQGAPAVVDIPQEQDDNSLIDALGSRPARVGEALLMLAGIFIILKRRHDKHQNSNIPHHTEKARKSRRPFRKAA